MLRHDPLNKRAASHAEWIPGYDAEISEDDMKWTKQDGTLRQFSKETRLIVSNTS